MECNELHETQDITSEDTFEDTEALWLDEQELTQGELAAQYLRGLEGNHEKLANYVERHYDNSMGAFSPDLPIPITTRNMDLDGQSHPSSGVEFSRQEVDMGDGVSITGVFPEFDSRFDIELGDDAKDMTLHEQFSACRDAFLDHMYDDPEILEGLTLEDMDHLDEGYFPNGCTAQHNPRVGFFSIVDSDLHRRTGHTGGNALWTPKVHK